MTEVVKSKERMEVDMTKGQGSRSQRRYQNHQEVNDKGH